MLHLQHTSEETKERRGTITVPTCSGIRRIYNDQQLRFLLLTVRLNYIMKVGNRDIYNIINTVCNSYVWLGYNDLVFGIAYHILNERSVSISDNFKFFLKFIQDEMTLLALFPLLILFNSVRMSSVKEQMFCRNFLWPNSWPTYARTATNWLCLLQLNIELKNCNRLGIFLCDSSLTNRLFANNKKISQSRGISLYTASTLFSWSYFTALLGSINY